MLQLGKGRWLGILQGMVLRVIDPDLLLQCLLCGLYLLDEPENSLSPKRQLELLALIEDAAWYTGCQFVISTHSPFLMAMRGAKVYDLDEDPVTVKPWTELETVRTYFEFFQRYEREFEPISAINQKEGLK